MITLKENQGSLYNDTRYFISSLKDVQKAGKAVRSHWGIENKFYWSLDVTFDEDCF